MILGGKCQRLQLHPRMLPMRGAWGLATSFPDREVARRVGWTTLHVSMQAIGGIALYRRGRFEASPQAAMLERGSDQALSGAFADPELAGELRAEASKAGAGGSGLVDECMRGVQAGILGVG